MLHLRVPLVLASRSPRRRDLLRRLGLAFTVCPGDVDEVLPPDLTPADAAAAVARAKGEAVAPRFPEALTLAADTVVVLDGEALGKPRDPAEAVVMLRRLAGRTHTVCTGIALCHPASGRAAHATETTEVTFAPLDEHEIAAYVATGSPLDKAGAYGIQDDHGALFVSGIRGDYYNVVGLPLHRLYRLLRERFADLLG